MKLGDRIARVEAELAIRNVIARYGMAADCGDVKTALNCHSEDAVYVVSNPNAGRGEETSDLELHGHKAISEMLLSEMHQSLLPDCAHTVGPLVVDVTGESAEVLGYSRVYHNQELMRLAINRWTIRQEDSEWKIVRRESRIMGTTTAQDLLKKGLQND